MDSRENVRVSDVAGKENTTNPLTGIVVAKNASHQMERPMMMNATEKMLVLANAATLGVAEKGSMKNHSLGIAVAKSASFRMEKHMKLGVIGGMDKRGNLKRSRRTWFLTIVSHVKNYVTAKEKVGAWWTWAHGKKRMYLVRRSTTIKWKRR